MSRARLLDQLRAALPSRCLITDPRARVPFETDGLTAVRATPWLVVLPESVAQLRSVLRACRECAVPMVPRGAGTGLSGGARPLSDGVLLGLSKLSRILEIDPENRLARVEPGVRNLAVSEAAAPHGLYYAPDPSSQIACSIGGNVAENAGGVHCLKYGLTVHNVLGLKVLTSEGDELTIGGRTFDSPGFDLLALFNGSEGLLGIVTEITLRLLPIPAAKRVLLGAFADIGSAADAVSRIIARGIVPAGLEMMDRLAIEGAEAYAGAGYPLVEAILLCELDGDEEEVATSAVRVSQVMKDHGALEIRVAQDAAERERFWRGRKAAFPAMGRLAPDYYCMDGTIPRSRLREVLSDIARLSERFGLRVANVFHAGDGNLHPLILYDASKPGEVAKVVEMGGAILERCIAAGGTVTGEHGVGVEKLDQMCVQFSADELAAFHAVKAAFDPDGLLNPGKAVPTLARCGELGGMHVHRGRLPFPELERF